MDRESLINYLESYERLKLETESITCKLTGIRSAMGGGGKGAQSGQSVSSRYDTLISKRDDRLKQMSDIEDFVLSNFTGKGMSVIYRYYICGQPYKEIAKALGYYSTSSISKLRAKAIDDYIRLH